MLSTATLLVMAMALHAGVGAMAGAAAPTCATPAGPEEMVVVNAKTGPFYSWEKCESERLSARGRLLCAND